MKIIDVLNSPWAIQPEKLSEIISIYGAHVRGERIDIKAIEAQIGKPLVNEQKRYEVIDGIAVIPVEGVLAKKMNLFMEISGGTSTQMLMKDFREALVSEDVQSILFHIDSPGGTVNGTQELASVIYQSRGIKPIVALADGMMASAAYWIGAAADKVYITSATDIIGNIGVVTAHKDISKSEEMRGIKTTEIYAGKYKRISSGYAPLSEEGRQTIQGHVDYVYSIFVDAIGGYRGVDTDAVIEKMADGRVFIGKQAVDAGLVDGIVGFEGLLSMMADDASTGSVFGSKREWAGLEPAPTGSNRGNMVQNEITTLQVNSKKGETEMSKDANSNDVQAKTGVVTAESIRASNPEVAEALLNEGYAAGKAAGTIAGAEAECQRIRDVEAQAMPGHEDLIASLKFDGKTTGPEAAVQVVKAEKQANAKVLTDIETKSPEVIPQSMAAEVAESEDKAQGEEADEESLKKQWDADANLRSEFVSFDDYKAYNTANNKSRIHYFRKGDKK